MTINNWRVFKIWLAVQIKKVKNRIAKDKYSVIFVFIALISLSFNLYQYSKNRQYSIAFNVVPYEYSHTKLNQVQTIHSIQYCDILVPVRLYMLNSGDRKINVHSIRYRVSGYKTVKYDTPYTYIQFSKIDDLLQEQIISPLNTIVNYSKVILKSGQSTDYIGAISVRMRCNKRFIERYKSWSKYRSLVLKEPMGPSLNTLWFASRMYRDGRDFITKYNINSDLPFNTTNWRSLNLDIKFELHDGTELNAKYKVIQDNNNEDHVLKYFTKCANPNKASSEFFDRLFVHNLRVTEEMHVLQWIAGSSLFLRKKYRQTGNSTFRDMAKKYSNASTKMTTLSGNILDRHSPLKDLLILRGFFDQCGQYKKSKKRFK